MSFLHKLFHNANARVCLREREYRMNAIDSEPSDAEMIERVRTNDLEALGQLFDRYYNRVYLSAVAITQNSAAAEEIATECFLKVHRYANQIDTSLPLTPWLYRMTDSLSYRWVARQMKK